jgi:hypothetical protein
MKKSFGTVILLSAATLILGLIACKGTTVVSSIIWIKLDGPAPTVSETGARTATLSLDFSEPVGALKPGLSETQLGEIFRFTYYNDGNIKTQAEIQAVEVTPNKIGAGNVYNLVVRGVPQDGGRVEVAIATLPVEPTIRPWYLDGTHSRPANRGAQKRPTASAKRVCEANSAHPDHRGAWVSNPRPE